mmetsp:Transcript_17423/g.26132  ORF Transcript_17423/g.26132 Transcript_17423/m.26132 type:complete len:122 (-) Transcript_17423:185-550(-)
MRKEIVVLGRSSQKFCADVPMGPDTHISRKHASVYYSEKSGRFKMKVYGQNGIHVNDKLVPVGSSIDLDNKVTLRAGNFTCIFEGSPPAERNKYVASESSESCFSKLVEKYSEDERLLAET